jgi:multiple sugar transport system ATP-binding protein
MASVQFAHATRRFQKSERPAVNGLDLSVADKDFLVLVGPSGCGKTTSLRMLAGLEAVDEGTIRIDGADVTQLSPPERDIAMVFQNYALYPHMSVADNMGFALKVGGISKDERYRRVHKAAVLLDLVPYLDRRPGALSGGQRQRVAMGRAIVREPQAFLMDEPLSNLDAQLRVQTRAEIRRLQRELGVTTIYVTHDQTEAMTMGDYVAVMRSGELQQVDTPSALYERPVNRFVAGFLGSPSMNLVVAVLRREGDGLFVDFGAHELLVDAGLAQSRPALRAYEGRKIVIGIRPEDIEDTSLATGTPPTRRLRVICELREALGSDVLVHFRVALRAADMDEGGDSDNHVRSTGTDFVARVDPRSPVREGEHIELAVDTARMHFFDRETGLAIYGHNGPIRLSGDARGPDPSANDAISREVAFSDDRPEVNEDARF